MVGREPSGLSSSFAGKSCSGGSEALRPPDGFLGSLEYSLSSIGTTYIGIYQWLTNDPTYTSTYQNAYNTGIFGQTKDASGFVYYGTRGAVGVSAAAVGAAGIVNVAGVGAMAVTDAAAASWRWLVGLGTAALGASQTPAGQEATEEVETLISDAGGETSEDRVRSLAGA